MDVVWHQRTKQPKCLKERNGQYKNKCCATAPKPKNNRNNKKSVINWQLKQLMQ
jgi:hypothetical protein